jgi:hypothetical protein
MNITFEYNGSSPEIGRATIILSKEVVNTKIDQDLALQKERIKIITGIALVALVLVSITSIFLGLIFIPGALLALGVAFISTTVLCNSLGHLFCEIDSETVSSRFTKYLDCSKLQDHIKAITPNPDPDSDSDFIEITSKSEWLYLLALNEQLEKQNKITM